MNKLLSFSSVLFIVLYPVSQDIYTQQKEGLIQEKEDSHIVFNHINKLVINSRNDIISTITKIIKRDNIVFILDGRQSKVFVVDNKAKYLYTIGRPGQGPGDLEHPSDFFITDNDLVYILNSMSNRIEVFSVDGRFIKRIQLIIPKEIFYSHPSGILVTRESDIIVAYSLSQHLIDIFNENGEYLRTLLKRENDVIIPGDNIGNCSQIQFYPQETAILHFDYFTGLFTKISKTGKIDKQFSASIPLHNKEVTKIQNDILAKRNEKKANSTSIKEFQLWSRFCMDEDQNVYVISLLRKKGENQKMYVFSSRGEYLYWINTPRINDIAYADDLYYFQGMYMFKTPDDEMFMIKKEKR